MTRSRLKPALAITLGVVNALLAFALVPVTPLLMWFAGGIGLGAPNRPNVPIYMAITFAGSMIVVGLFTWVAAKTLRDRRWHLRLQVAPIAMLVLLLAWIEVAAGLP